MKKAALRPLGTNQQLAMECLGRYRSWEPDGGWVLDNASLTVRTLESLVKRGLVKKEARRSDRMRGETYDVYTLTEAGKAHEEV